MEPPGIPCITWKIFTDKGLDVVPCNGTPYPGGEEHWCEVCLAEMTWLADLSEEVLEKAEKARNKYPEIVAYAEWLDGDIDDD